VSTHCWALCFWLLLLVSAPSETNSFGTVPRARIKSQNKASSILSPSPQEAKSKTTLHLAPQPEEDSTARNDGFFRRVMQLKPPTTGSSSTTEESTETCSRTTDADKLFALMDADDSGTIDLEELTNHMTAAGYSETVIAGVFGTMDTDANGEISRDEFRRALVDAPQTERQADMIFALLDADESGTIDLGELTQHLGTAGYAEDEIRALFEHMDTNQDGEISQQEFRNVITRQQGEPDLLPSQSRSFSNDDYEEASLMCPRGYFLNSVMQSCEPLGPLGRMSQNVETFGPLKRVYNGISNLCGIDTKRISKLGVSFALSYSIISNINGAISFSVAWYISCKQTGLSPLVPGQWKSLFRAYATIYAVIQLMRPFRVAGAIAMSKLSAEYLEMAQKRFNCSRTVAIALQYMLGWVMMGTCASLGVGIATLLTGVPMWGGRGV